MTSELLRVLADAAPKEHLSTDELLRVLYTELRALAQARLRRLPPGQTLQATALVHEAYLRLVRRGDPGWDNRAHFFAAAGQATRDILVEQARSKMNKKRGGGRVRMDSGSVEPTIEPPSSEYAAPASQVVHRPIEAVATCRDASQSSALSNTRPSDAVVLITLAPDVGAFAWLLSFPRSELAVSSQPDPTLS